jgi:hypothetical protein
MAQSSTHEAVKSVDDSEFDGARDRLPRWNFEEFQRMDLPRLATRADTWSDDDNQANFQHASFTDRDTD